MYRSEYESFINNPVWKEISSVLTEVMEGIKNDIMEMDPFNEPAAIAHKQGRYKEAEFVLALPGDILREIEEAEREERKEGKKDG